MAEHRLYAMRKVEEEATDFYSGSLDELVALGFAPREKFPGEPGQPLATVSIRPAGVDSPQTNWHREPGYVRINRTASGRYQMRVVVSHEERHRRKIERERREADRELEDAVWAPRPPMPVSDARASHHLKLVWSAQPQ